MYTHEIQLYQEEKPEAGGNGGQDNGHLWEGGRDEMGEGPQYTEM